MVFHNLFEWAQPNLIVSKSVWESNQAMWYESSP